MHMSLHGTGKTAVLDLGKPMITVADVERRMLRACRTLRAVPDPDRKFQWIGCVWPEVIRTVEESYGYTDEVMPRFRPTPADVSDYLTALGWARVVEWKDFKLIWWRSFEVSFKQIGMRIGRSDETARRWYRDCILRVWHEANRENQRDIDSRVAFVAKTGKSPIT